MANVFSVMVGIQGEDIHGSDAGLKIDFSGIKKGKRRGNEWQPWFCLSWKEG